jgi:hypothetical protein
MKPPETQAVSAEIAVEAPAGRCLSPAAQRALAEAEARRNQPQPTFPPEEDGRGGLEPVRYGDWEVKGIASDF